MDYSSFADNQGVLGGYDDDASIPARKRKCKECGQMGHTKRTCSIHGSTNPGEFDLSSAVPEGVPLSFSATPHPVYEHLSVSNAMLSSSSMGNVVLPPNSVTTTMRRRRQPPAEDNPLRYVGCHNPVLHKRPRVQGVKQEESRRRCVVCKKRIPYACKECDIALCFAMSSEEVSCWEKYHTPPGHAAIAANISSMPASIPQPQPSMMIATSTSLLTHDTHSSVAPSSSGAVA